MRKNRRQAIRQEHRQVLPRVQVRVLLLAQLLAMHRVQLRVIRQARLRQRLPNPPQQALIQQVKLPKLNQMRRKTV